MKGLRPRGSETAEARRSGGETPAPLRLASAGRRRGAGRQAAWPSQGRERPGAPSWQLGWVRGRPPLAPGLNPGGAASGAQHLLAPPTANHCRRRRHPAGRIREHRRCLHLRHWQVLPPLLPLPLLARGWHSQLDGCSRRPSCAAERVPPRLMRQVGQARWGAWWVPVKLGAAVFDLAGAAVAPLARLLRAAAPASLRQPQAAPAQQLS
jgi:hypothetical protein